MKRPDYDLAKGWWYAALLATVLLLVILFMPKKLKWQEIYVTFPVIGYLVWLVNIQLTVPFDIFDIGTNKKQGLPELLMYGVIPSCLSIIYLNLYKQERKWKLVLLFVLLSLTLEWIAVRVGLMTLKKYHTIYSLPVHFVAYAYFLPWHLKVIRRLK